jgi:hypothetical protein
LKLLFIYNIVLVERIEMKNRNKYDAHTAFWDGVSSAFDLLGVRGQSLSDLRAKNRLRRKLNSTKSDISMVGKDIKRAAYKYGKKT